MSAVALHPNAKLWNEREFNECCFPIGGVGRQTIVCATPCDGAYCRSHRALMDDHCGAISTRPQRRRDAVARRKIKPRGQTLDEIMDEVCARYGVTADDLIGPLRVYTPIRNEVWSRLKDAGKSFPWIGQQFGGRHHTTILAGVRKHREIAA